MHVCVCDFYVHSFTFSVFVDRLSFVDLTNLRLISISMKSWLKKVFCLIAFSKVLFIAVENIIDTLKALAGSQQGHTVVAATAATVPLVAPSMPLVANGNNQLKIHNVSYKCRPDPGFPEGDRIAAYAGVCITFIMAVYAR